MVWTSIVLLATRVDTALIWRYVGNGAGTAIASWEQLGKQTAAALLAAVYSVVVTLVILKAEDTTGRQQECNGKVEETMNSSRLVVFCWKQTLWQAS